MILDSSFLKEVEGGSAKVVALVAGIVAGLGVFIIGVVDGFLHPLKTLKKR